MRYLGGGGEVLKSTGILMQEAAPDVTTLVDDRSSFNELSRLVLLTRGVG